jgi:Dynamin family
MPDMRSTPAKESLTAQPQASAGGSVGSPPPSAPPAEAPGNLLRDYEAAKFELAGLIREASAASREIKQDTVDNELRAIMGRLAEDRFYLTLAGQYSRGKTTLLNAMLGTDRLPTGIVPVTSVITAVTHNARERVVLHFENSQLFREVSLAELPEWITERGNPGNARKIEMAEVQLPAELLRRGACFVDTPGLGSAVIENTATTQRFLGQIDALVLVTSFEYPLSGEELLFLDRARALGRRLFLVINKKDLCTPAQQEEVLGFTRSKLDQEGSAPVPIFTVSAAEALAARLSGDGERLEQSGLPLLERALVQYLIDDRYHDFLSATCQRIHSILTETGVPGFRQLQERLEEIQANRAGPGRARGEGDSESADAARQSLRITSCFICRRMANAAFEFLSRYQYDLSRSHEAQSLHAGRSGFCKLHSREYARLASPQGIASGYPLTLFFMAERLRLLSQNGRLREDWASRFDQILPSQQKCRACQAELMAEENVIQEFLAAYLEAPAQKESNLPCVCLRHLRAILQKAPGTALANRLVLHCAAALERTAENMERFAMRHGGLHRELLTDDDLASPEKGLNLLVGQTNVGL